MTSEYLYELNTKGYCKFSNLISDNHLIQMQNAVDTVLKSNDPCVRANHFFLAHNFSTSFLKIIQFNPLQGIIDKVLGDTSIIHSFNGITLRPSISNPIQNAVHRDSPRFCRPYLLSLQVIVLLDDFTKENGGTYVLPGSQYLEEKPNDEYFYKNAVQIEGKAGDLVLFDAMLWHAGGTNTTNFQRRALTIVYSRSFMKQQIDLTKATQKAILDSADANLLRLLGFNVRVPASIEEFNLPSEQRLYKSNQG